MRDQGDGRALVLGGGMAGLLAARVLAEHRYDVRVLDRDDLRSDDAPRRGVPQDRHIHALLPRGREIMEELFPGITDELIGADVPCGDLLGDARLHFGGHRLQRTRSGLLALSLSRPLLEARVRARVRRLPCVAFDAPCDVLGLTASASGRRITGVRVLRRAAGSTEETLHADVVVDALGRGSPTPRWLESLGLPAPPEEQIGVDVGYATRLYRLDHRALDGDWGTLQAPTPDVPRGGVLARIDGGRWMVSLIGLVGDHPPPDPAGFLAFARSLRFADLHDAISGGEPLGPPVAFRFPAGVRRRYEDLRALPDGLFPLGDSVCSLNPLYGQGMTVAGLGALALRDQLRDGTRPHPRRHARSVARVVDPAWQVALGGDLAIPQVEGPRTLRLRTVAAYVARLHAAAAHDPELAAAFVRVMAMVDTPTALLRPGIASRVLWSRGRATSGPPTVAEPGPRAHQPRRCVMPHVRMLLAALLTPTLAVFALIVLVRTLRPRTSRRRRQLAGVSSQAGRRRRRSGRGPGRRSR